MGLQDVIYRAAHRRNIAMGHPTLRHVTLVLAALLLLVPLSTKAQFSAPVAESGARRPYDTRDDVVRQRKSPYEKSYSY